MLKAKNNLQEALCILKKAFNAKFFRLNYRIISFTFVVVTGIFFKTNADIHRFSENGCDGVFDPYNESLWCQGCCEDVIPGGGIGTVHFCGLTEDECEDFEYPDESNRGECPECVYIERLEGDFNAEEIFRITYVPTGVDILVTDWEKEDDGEGGFYINFETYEGDGG